MKKFLRNTILIAGCVLIAGGGTGGIYWYRTAKAKKATVKVYSPAPIFTDVVSYFAADMRLAVKRFQIS